MLGLLTTVARKAACGTVSFLASMLKYSLLAACTPYAPCPK